MKNFRIVFLLFSVFAFPSFSIAEDSVWIDRKGMISIGGHRLQMVFFNRNWVSRPQDTPIPGIYRIEDREAGRVRIGLHLPEGGEGTLDHRLEKTAENGWTLATEVSFQTEPNVRSGVMALRIPAAENRGLKLRIDGKEVICPIRPPEKSAIFFRKQCSELCIPAKDGEWIFRGSFFLLIQDERCFRNGRDFEFRFSLVPCRKDRRYPAKLNLEIEHRIPKWQPIDLRPVMNMGLADRTAGDAQGGWTDQGPENDLRMLWENPEKLPGEFRLIRPEENGGKTCLMLRGRARPYFPAKAELLLRTPPQGRYLYLLHALAWGGTNPALGEVILTYTDGTVSKIELRAGRDVGNWWRPSALENGIPAWIGENASSYIGLYRSMFEIRPVPVKKVEFRSVGNAVWGILAATVGDFEIPRSPRIPSYILAGKEWRILKFEKEIRKGSALDFSGWLDAPAGKYGPVVIRNGHFEFQKRPGTPVRFYGTNLCSQAAYPDREWAERIAERIAKAGFNAVRLHHHDALMVNRQKTTELSAGDMDRLDYLIACLKKQGIYIQTDLFVSRRPAAGEIPGCSRRMENFDLYKALLYFQEPVFENWKGYVRNFLNHVNPYTGFAMKDEPALISLTLVNEGNIHKKWDADALSRKCALEQFEQWLGKRGDVAEKTAKRSLLFDRFLTEVYRRRHRQMVEYVRSLGCVKPLSDQNMGCSPQLSSMRLSYDFVDNHLYFNHPEFAGKSWGLPSYTRTDSVLKHYAEVPAWLFASRIYGKPFMVTEFDFARPNPHRADGALLFGVYGSLQQWDGLFQFAYTHGMEKIMYSGRTDAYFDLATDPVKLLSQYLGMAFFLNAELEHSRAEACAVVLPSGRFIRNEELNPAEYGRIGLCRMLGTVSSSGEGAFRFLPGTRPELRNILKNFAPDGCYRAAGGAVFLDPKRSVFQAVSPRAEAFILPSGAEADGRFCRVKNQVASAVIGFVACDRKTLFESRRMLLLHLTDSAATKQRYSDQDHRCLESWGTLPFLAARGEAEVTLFSQSGRVYRLFAVDTSGKRLEEVPLKSLPDGSLTASLNVFRKTGSVFAYELERLE